MKWLRVRFYTNAEDPRPVKFPPPGPYWITGQTENGTVIVAYLRRIKQLWEFWPEAIDAEHDERGEMIFTDRFPKPDWWKPTPEAP